MTFLAPAYLWLLLAVAALGVGYVGLQQRRRHYAVRFANLELLAAVAPRRPGWRRHIAAAGVALSLIAFVVALARPVRTEQIPREEATVVLAVDVSASMTATDVTPSRIAAAKSAAIDFVSKLPAGFRVGLLAYDGTVSTLATPTTDHASVVHAITTLTTGPGTASGDAIYTALSVIAASRASDTSAVTPANHPTAAIVLVSDGASTVGRPVTDASAAAVQQGVPVTTVAYGTDTGSVVVQGKTIKVPADDAAMQTIAQTTGGQYFAATSASELRSVYQTIQSKVGYTPEQREILRWFLGIGVVALIGAVAASMVWTARFL